MEKLREAVPQLRKIREDIGEVLEVEGLYQVKAFEGSQSLAAIFDKSNISQWREAEGDVQVATPKVDFFSLQCSAGQSIFV